MAKAKADAASRRETGLIAAKGEAEPPSPPDRLTHDAHHYSRLFATLRERLFGKSWGSLLAGFANPLI